MKRSHEEVESSSDHSIFVNPIHDFILSHILTVIT